MIRSLFFCSLMIVSCSHRAPKDLGVSAGQFSPCPASPNCVSSFANPDDEKHYFAPIVVKPSSFKGGVLEVIVQKATKVLGCTVSKKTESYLHAECKSKLMGFVDDLQVFYEPSKSMLYFKSASRVGYSDLGVNNKRLQKLQAALP